MHSQRAIAGKSGMLTASGEVMRLRGGAPAKKAAATAEPKKNPIVSARHAFRGRPLS